MIISQHPKSSPAAVKGPLASVWKLPIEDFEALEQADLKIEVSTMADGGGLMTLPVGSIGRIGEDVYFAADHRFVCYAGADCLYPTDRRLDLRLRQITGGWRGALWFREILILGTGVNKTPEAVMAILARWVKAQPEGSWIIPEKLLSFQAAEDVQTGV